MNSPRVLLLDQDDSSASAVLAYLRKRGFNGSSRIAHRQVLPIALAAGADVVIVSHFHDAADSLAACDAVKRFSPSSDVIVLVAPGPALCSVSDWSSRTPSVDAIVQKPLQDAELADSVRRLSLARALYRTARLEKVIPVDALARLSSETDNAGELFPAALLFTDVRRSTDLITRLAPQAFFGMINSTLSRQAAVVRRFGGSVVKYTGDGTMAIFRGMGRSHLAIRCARELILPDLQDELPFGVGAAGGLVMAGFVGAADGSDVPRQYDVIGATVHLSARLCSMAGPGQMLLTRTLYTSARLPIDSAGRMEKFEVKGFSAPVDCIGFGGGAGIQRKTTT